MNNNPPAKIVLNPNGTITRGKNWYAYDINFDVEVIDFPSYVYHSGEGEREDTFKETLTKQCCYIIYADANAPDGGNGSKASPYNTIEDISLALKKILTTTCMYVEVRCSGMWSGWVTWPYDKLPYNFDGDGKRVLVSNLVWDVRESGLIGIWGIANHCKFISDGTRHAGGCLTPDTFGPGGYARYSTFINTTTGAWLYHSKVEYTGEPGGFKFRGCESKFHAVINCKWYCAKYYDHPRRNRPINIGYIHAVKSEGTLEYDNDWELNRSSRHPPLPNIILLGSKSTINIVSKIRYKKGFSPDDLPQDGRYETTHYGVRYISPSYSPIIESLSPLEISFGKMFGTTVKFSIKDYLPTYHRGNFNINRKQRVDSVEITKLPRPLFWPYHAQVAFCTEGGVISKCKFIFNTLEVKGVPEVGINEQQVGVDQGNKPVFIGSTDGCCYATNFPFYFYEVYEHGPLTGLPLQIYDCTIHTNIATVPRTGDGGNALLHYNDYGAPLSAVGGSGDSGCGSSMFPFVGDAGYSGRGFDSYGKPIGGERGKVYGGVYIDGLIAGNGNSPYYVTDDALPSRHSDCSLSNLVLSFSWKGGQSSKSYNKAPKEDAQPQGVYIQQLPKELQ